MDSRREVAELRINLHNRQSLLDLTTAFWRAAVGGVGAVLAGVLDAMHESRRRQSAREIARHRHLIEGSHARTIKAAGEDD